MKSRIAPTPSGFLHLGNAANFLLTHAVVRAEEGQLLLRIDDLDATRARDEYIEHVFSTLVTLGIKIDEGPTNQVALAETWSQHHRIDLYQKALQTLKSQGVLYACNCSRKKISQLYPDAIYRGECREKGIPLDEAGVAWRIKVPKNTTIHLPEYLQPVLANVGLANDMGDFVVRKKDGLPAYQIASLIDDCYFEVSTIVRGEDLLLSSAAQLYLAQLLKKTNFLANLKLYHHPLLKDENGRKMSKSAGTLAIEKSKRGDLDLIRIKQAIKRWLAVSRLANKEEVSRLI